MVARTEQSLPLVDVDAFRGAHEAISKLPRVECREVEHCFTPGLYTREIVMFPGKLYQSRIHKTKHQYIISDGSCLVSTNGGPWEMFHKHFHGITEPGTWRLIFPLLPTRWTTMHATDKTTPEEVEADITEPLGELT